MRRSTRHRCPERKATALPISNDAMKAIRAANRSGESDFNPRRSDEVTLLLQGKYEKDGHPISL